MNAYPVCVSSKRAWTVDKDDLIDAYTDQAQKSGLTLWDESTLGEVIEEGLVDPADYPALEPHTRVWKSDFVDSGKWRFEELSVWEATKMAARHEGITIYDSHIDALMNEDRESFRDYILSQEGLFSLFSEAYMNPSLYPGQVAERLHRFISQGEN